MQLPAIGEVVAEKYRIEEVLGEGGFGRVYRGTRELSERAVAIKVLKPGRQGYDGKRTKRFLRELRAVAKLGSPYTLTLFDYGRTESGLLFMVTEYIDGEDLEEVLARRGTLSERETAHVVMQVLQSLAEAHDHGLIHRDLKPANIRVFEYQGDPLRTKLLDFGLAQSLRAEGETRLTGTGRVVGTPRYMSPEQLRGKDLTPASDLYSLGLVALECVLGRVAGHFRAVDGPPRLQESDPVSAAFRTVVNHLLDADPSERIRTAEAAYAAFRLVRSDLRSGPAYADSAHDAPTVRMIPDEPDTLPQTLEDRPPPRPPETPRKSPFRRDPLDRPPPDTQQTPAPWLRWLLAGVPLAVVFVAVAVVAGRNAVDEPAPVQRPTVHRGNAAQKNLLQVEREVVGIESAGCAHEFPQFTALEDKDLTVHAPLGYQHEATPLVTVPGKSLSFAELTGLPVSADRNDFLLFALPDEAAPHARLKLEAVMDALCVDREKVYLINPPGDEQAVCNLPQARALAFVGLGTLEPLDCERRLPVVHIAAHPSNEDDDCQFSGFASTLNERATAYWTEANGCTEPKRTFEQDGMSCTAWDCETPFVSCTTEGTVWASWRGCSWLEVRNSALLELLTRVTGPEEISRTE